MKALLAALLLAASLATAAQTPPTTSEVQTEALIALARTYGAVRYFHPSDSLDKVKWNRFLVHAAERMGSVTRRPEIAPRLEELFSPIVDGFLVAPAGASGVAPTGEGPRVEWRHLGYGMEPDPRGPYASWRTHHDPLHGAKIKGGYFQHRDAGEMSKYEDPVMRVEIAPRLEAHIAVSLPMSATKVGEAQQARLDKLAAAIEPVRTAAESVSSAQAHADGIALWNVARHFYPYWAVVRIDWEAQLRKWLGEQPESQTRAELRDSLARLTAPLDDGHAHVHDPADRRAKQWLPISIRPLGGEWVVDASLVPDQVKPGDVLAAVGGKPAAQWFAERIALASGSAHHKPWRVRLDLLLGPRDESIELRLARGGQEVEATLAYRSPQPLQAPRPPAIHEVSPGIHYIDVTRFDKAAFEKSVEALAGARGIVFDLRGYPGGEAFALPRFWLTGEDRAQWMFVPRFDKPFAASTTGWSNGWQVARDAALAKPAKVLLVDGRAISYAESLTGYFPAQRTGPLVGEATAGTNGNVARATLPSGMLFFFTGMRVTRHDATLLHREGFKPDIAATPTIEGIRAGRDEVLERAIAEIARKP